MINILDLTFEDAEISKVGLLKCRALSVNVVLRLLNTASLSLVNEIACKQ